jgi:excisionase family DNA binding protein
MHNEELLTVRQVAEQLGISKYQVYRRIVRGDLPAQQARNGNVHYLIRAQALRQYIAAGGADVLSSPRADNQGMLRASEVAQITGFSVEAIRRMCKEGRLAHIRGAGPKGHLRIPNSAVDALLSDSRR